MIDLTKLDAPLDEVADPEPSGPSADDSKMNEPARVVGPVTYQGFPLRYAYRRAYSELQLLDLLAGEVFREGTCYVFLSRGNVDLMSYLQVVLRMQDVTRLGLSTWNANLPDVSRLVQLHDEGRIGRMDLFLGTVNRVGAEARQNIEEYRKLVGDRPDIRISIAKTHIKAFWGIGPQLPFVITGSANLNTNVNMEAMTVLVSYEAYAFFCDFFKEQEAEL
ncbi:MAG: hypothetical protein IJL93_07850 [Bacteroidales bacterium]|nr:hypothetical protein [Bacteroidales bacterium]